jgi:nucleoside-diphosphate-sugar epimerase
MRIVITGATGYVAYFLVRALCNDHTLDCWLHPGHSRTRERFHRLHHSHVSYREVDLADARRVRDALEDAQAIIHLAYAHTPGKYRDGHGDDLDGWFRSNLDFQLNLVLGAHARGVRNFVYLSSRAVYGSGPIRFSESDPPRPDSHYGSLKAASELLLSGFDALRHCSIRSTGVYGCVEPVEASKWFDLLCALRERPILRKDRVGSEVHGGDLARVIALLLQTSASWPSVINVSCLIVSYAMLADAFSRRTGVAVDVLERLPSPGGMMACDWLTAADFGWGGPALFEHTLERMLDACERQEAL